MRGSLLSCSVLISLKHLTVRTAHVDPAQVSEHRGRVL